ncbi:unnamed protein product [Thlaspi arvense]|uniref:FBD domain-containing protein n=1 Tax=Thlaspi arvense TaxID=13288 RepID=A0AAU9SGK3_THLAR|nr:unnamed protein product [Thlaspi arvense]
MHIGRSSLDVGEGEECLCVSRWISNVMERKVSHLDLRVTVNWDDSMPASIFVSKSLVTLRIEAGNGACIDVEDVFLPNLKNLHLDCIAFGNGDHSLVKLISACHVLEELVLIHVTWDGYLNRSVSSKTLKRLTLRCEDCDRNPDSVSFDTPNFVYFEYADHVAYKYEISSFDSLVQASIACTCKLWRSLVGNATELLKRISNVQILYLFANTLEVLTFCCEPIPVFKNLIHLTVKTHWDIGWESSPALLKNCPNVETLVFEGLHHKNTIKCEDVDGCLCKSSEEISSFLSSSPVKILKILKFGEISVYSDDKEKQKQVELVKYFLDIMPNLEQMILCYNARIDEDLKSRVERLVTRGSSSKCNVQLISDNISEPIYPYSFDD